MGAGAWERGDLLGHDVPVHLHALRAAGPDHLTSAFRAAGTLDAGNRVAAITELEPFSGGSTGRKALLSVAYEQPRPDLPERLFVKLSRDPDDELRDRGRWQMEAEVRFGLLSQLPDFPVAVPRCAFGDFHLASGTGILISERIAFGEGAIEPHRAKARDHELDDPLPHYEALVAALGRLAGAHRAGRFPADLMAHFEPRLPGSTSTRPRSVPDPDRTRDAVRRYAGFAERHPQLLPEELRTDAFLSLLLQQAPRSVEHADALRAALREGAGDLTAFCHWNANIDNAWFWREGGELRCGLLDWGNVGQIDVVTALSSALTFAEPDLLLQHLDHLLARFSDELDAAGGGRIEPSALDLQLRLQMVAGGLRWPLGAVPLLEQHVPDLDDVADRFDPRILEDEHARTQLHLLISYLTLWQRSDPESLIDWAVARFGS